MTGCSEDLITDTVHSGRTIRFEVSDTDGWHNVPQSRAATDSANTAQDPVAPQPLGALTLQGDTPADTLFLHASVSGGIDGARFVRPETKTRATPVTTETFYNAFGVLASVYDGEWDENSCTPQYMYDVEVTKNSNWTTSYLWPGNGRSLRFFAYAPYRGAGIQLSDKAAVGTPRITYTVPAEVADQQDLCVAVADNTTGSENSSTSLTFNHVLTAVKFITGDKVLAGNISKITLKKVYGKATLSMGTDSWTVHESPSEFFQTVNVDVDGSAGQAITSDVATFMMLPQTLPDGAQIEVIYTDNLTSTQRTLTASIAGTLWPMGKTVTYKISTTSIDITPVFTVTAPSFIYKGGDGTYTVTSYATVSRVGDTSQDVPVGWTAEFVEGNEENGYIAIEQPDWLTAFTLSDQDGSTTATEYTASASGQEGVDVNTHNETLEKATSVGSKNNPYNLSNANGETDIQRTANCYVINAPGTYSLPLVYGNAIDNTKNQTYPYYNTSAYSQNVTQDGVLSTFLNHKGIAITSPYIYENENCTPGDVKLIWQDAKNLVSDIALSSDNHSLIFTVNQTTIVQGNAVIAVLDANDKVMWSWHIWVTDYKLGDDLKTVSYSGTSHTMLPCNLGWCDGPVTTYEGRSVKVRFTQDKTREQQIITVSQMAGVVSVLGNNPFYQWGRKDPMLPSTGGTGRINKTWYDNGGNTSTKWPTDSWNTGIDVITNGILNPGTYCNNNNMDGTYYNLWAADANSASTNYDYDLETSDKTVYDPCPVGYKVPLLNVHKTLINSSNEWSDSEKGRYFNCSGGSVFFPASGTRSGNNPSSVGSYGCYWLATPRDKESSGYKFDFTSTYVSNVSFYSRSYGCSVRPVQE